VGSNLGHVKPQSLEVSKINKNKKNFEKFWSSIINKDQNISRFFLFLFIFETDALHVFNMKVFSQYSSYIVGYHY
jgi:hypothetical protein